MTRGSREVYENRWIRVREDDVLMPNGEPGLYGVVSLQNPSVFVVAVTADDEIVLVRQWRYTIGRDSWEIPAGSTDGDEVVVAAARELREEAGYAAARFTVLPTVYSLNGVCDAPGHVVVAEDLTRVAAPGELAEEGIADVRTVEWSDAFDLIRRGEIHDGETLAAILYAAIALGQI